MPSPFGLHRKILRLGLPILIGQLGIILTAFADTFMVGHYSTGALASASFVNNLFNTAVFTVMGFSYGLTPLAGALYARGCHRRIGALMRTATIVNIFVALAVTGVMFFIYLNLHRLGQPAELLPVIRPYYLLYLAGLPAVALFSVWSQWSYAINRTVLPTVILLSANALNIFGNWLLIYGNWGCPEMGLTGAGISTLAARILCPAVLIAVFILARKFRRYRQGFAAAGINRTAAAGINRTSWPVALQMSFESGSFTMAAVMAGWVGTIGLASFQVVMITGMLGFMVYYSFGTAVAVMVSNAAGTADRPLMRRIAWAGYHIELFFAVAASAIFLLFSRQIMAVFTDDPAVYAAAVALVVPLVLYQLGDATQINFANALRGTSRVMPMLWIAFVAYIVVGTPAMYLLGFPLGLGVTGIILSFSVSLFLAAALFLWYFLRATR